MKETPHTGMMLDSDNLTNAAHEQFSVTQESQIGSKGDAGELILNPTS